MSTANKLQLNLLKTKEIVFRRPTVHLDILPVKLCDIERLDYVCVKLLGVFTDSKLLFSEHVERLLGVCNQQLYLLYLHCIYFFNRTAFTDFVPPCVMF